VDKATLGGLLLALGGIFLGLFLEGGNVGQLLQPTAAMIVFGGTLGAVLINFPLLVVWSAFLRLAYIFREPDGTARSRRTAGILSAIEPSNSDKRSLPTEFLSAFTSSRREIAAKLSVAG